MKFTGKLKGRLIDCHTILFESEEDFRQAYDELKDYEKLDKNGGSNCEY